MTLFDKIKNMTKEELARFLIYEGYDVMPDYYMSGDDEVECTTVDNGYICSDGTFFIKLDNAYEYQINLLERSFLL